MATDKSIQQALTQPYSLAYFIQHVLRPIFGEQLTIYASSVPMPLNASETRVATVIKKYGEIKLTDYRQVDLYEVALSGSVIVERNKVSIGAVVKKLIAGNNAVLANFHYPDQPNRSWRFSFIAKDQILEGDETQRVETNPKRYTYILGPHERCRTAGERFSKLSTQAEFTVPLFEEAFSVEKLSKKFFDDYKEHYEAFVEHLNKRETKASIFKGDEKAVRDFAKKLLGRIVFLYFVQKKGWLGASNEKWQDGDQNFIQNLFITSKKKETFYHLWLRKLFYDSLNNPERKHNDFELPNGNIVKVPYLNGGLFEDDDPKGILTFPPRLFEDLFDFFNQYNFTIYEDSPDDHTVAVDPEMLGHIFENLLEDNKDKGAYYTPKEIVHYMCQESLIEYLATKLDIPESTTYRQLGKDQTQMFGNEVKRGQFDLLNEDKTPTPGITRADVERFIKHKETTSQIIAHAKEIKTFLDDVKICDPAIGSGAFPMGLLQEIFHAKQVLKETADLADLLTVSSAEMKESIIQNSIYGVDIEKGAVDIARLRFWLSLIVDEEEPRPLPNLDYKIVVGDSLLPKLKVGEEDEVVDIDWEAKYTTSANEKLYKKLQADLQELVAKQKKYFSARTEKDKTKLKQTIRDLKIEILTSQLQLDKVKYSSTNVVNEELFGAGKKAKQKELEVTLKLAGFQKTLKHLEHLQKHPNKPLQFFDWKLDFPEILNSAIAQREGFDIVIGNPPYVRQEEIKEMKPALEKRFQCYTGTSDLYVYLWERGVTLVRFGGTITYISSNKFFRAGYGEKLRKFLTSSTKLRTLIDFGDRPVFEATTYPCILISTRSTSVDENVLKARSIETLEEFSRFDYVVTNDSITMRQSDLGVEGWRIEERSVLALLEKIKKAGVTLEVYAQGKIYRGVVTGYNEAFIIDEKTKKQLIKEDKKSAEVIKPFLRGRDIKRYAIDNPNLFLIFTRRGVDIENYPAIEKHLRQFKKELTPGGKDGRKPGSYKWHEIQDSIDYWMEFEKPKIIWGNLGAIATFTIDIETNYVNAPGCIIPIGDKYLLGAINSRLGDYFFHQVAAVRRGGYLEYKPMYVSQLPIATPSENQRRAIEERVEKILAAKKRDNKANTHALEREIDIIVYHLYNLTYAEAKVIDPTLREEEFEKGRSE